MCKDYLLKLCGDKKGKWFMSKGPCYKECFDNFEYDAKEEREEEEEKPEWTDDEEDDDSDAEDEEVGAEEVENDQVACEKGESDSDSNYSWFELPAERHESHSTGLCIEDPTDFIIQHPKQRDKSTILTSIYYKRCDGLYKNALGHRFTNIPRVNDKCKAMRFRVGKQKGADERISRKIAEWVIDCDVDRDSKEDFKIRFAEFHKDARYHPGPEGIAGHETSDYEFDSDRHLYEGDTPSDSDDDRGMEDKAGLEEDAGMKEHVNEESGDEVSIKGLDEEEDSEMDEADEREEGSGVDGDGDSDMD